MDTRNLKKYDWTAAQAGDIFTADLIQTNGHKPRPMLVNAVIPDTSNTDNYHLICTPITSKGINSKSVYKRYNINASLEVNDALNERLKTNYESCFRASEMVFLSGAEIKNSHQTLKFVGNLNEIKNDPEAIQKANDLIDEKHSEIGRAYQKFKYQKENNTKLYQDKMWLAYAIEKGDLLSDTELSRLTTAPIIDANIKQVKPDKYHLKQHPAKRQARQKNKYPTIPNEPKEGKSNGLEYQTKLG